MKIYTRTGDEGQTGLVGGGRTAKHSARICAVGDVDELNTCLGLARCESAGTELEASLGHIQNLLFDLGGELASPPGASHAYQALSATQIELLEGEIDSMSEALPPLRNFILPGGVRLAAELHHARAVCRRAERTVLALHETEVVRAEARAFLNRLADWLFVAARTANASQGVLDVEWRKVEGT